MHLPRTMSDRRQTVSALSKQFSKGFTITELLIALLILAQIATFTIPKVLQAQATSRKTAVFKEAIATISEIAYLGNIQGITGSGYNGGYIFQNLNGVKICDTNSQTQSCWPQVNSTSRTNEEDEPGMILHSGASIAGLNNNGGNNNGIILDYNGSEGPNLDGEDQISLTYCYAASGCPGDSLKGGQVSVTFWDAASVTLYRSIFN